MPSIDNGSDLGIEAALFKAADKLRDNIEPSDYKHVALDLIFLKHIPDRFEAKRAVLLAEYPEGTEDTDEYLDVLGNDKLKIIAHELLKGLKANVSIDWAHRDSARPRLRVLVKRILRTLTMLQFAAFSRRRGRCSRK